MCSRASLVCCLAAAALVTVYAQRLELYEGDPCKRVAGVEWTCKKIKDCAKAQEDLKNGLRPLTCGFSDNEVIVCCQPTTPVITKPTPTPTPTQIKPTQGKSKQGDVCKREAGVEWTCKKIKDCAKAQEDFKNGIRPLTCGFSDNEVIVCCQPTTPVTTKPIPTPTQTRPTQGKSKQMCRKYAESVFTKIPSFDGQVQTLNLCGLSIEPLITNGTKAQPREFPHMALIGYGDKNNIKWKCGGSLISERWVLSAAHCTLPGNDRPKWVRLGEYDVRSTVDDDEKIARSEDFEIIETINHPQYDKENQYNDIALYKLNRDVVFDEYVRPICLQTKYRIPKREGLITGWGRIGYNQRASNILLKGNVTFISGRQCRDSLETIENLKREIRDNTMICAANFLTNTDTCQGDSGGPLQYLLNDPYCMYSQVGITSFGIRCASNFPAVYTRVSYFVPWIESIVWP